MRYIIGDVHGHYDSLLALIRKLPRGADLIFVGDLIDRGKKSKEVVGFVRENNFQVVRGNHEELMIDYGKNFINTYPKSIYTSYLHTWLNNGGKQTLLSYGLIEISKDGQIICIKNQEGFEQFKKDVEWFETLPLYIKLEDMKNKKPIVISHGNIGNVWHFHDNKDEQELFKEYALWNRKSSDKDCEIFNIFGHTPVPKAETDKHFINVDTGCYMDDIQYSKLSCYCIEEDRIISIRRVEG